MNEENVISETREFVKNKMSGEGTGHDWFHVERVVRIAKQLAEQEGDVNLFIVEIAALLHDIGDWKFHDDESEGANITEEWLESKGVGEEIIKQVCHIVQYISFKGGTNYVKLTTKEGQIVQDADRLDALGAIGIGRAFAYGGYKGREMYNPAIQPKTYSSTKEYKNSVNTTISHFYEKLLRLKDLMHTDGAKKIAEERQQFMEEFLERFYREWKGEQ